MTLYMYIAPGQGQTAPRGQSLHAYSPGAGLTTPWECNFDVNRNILSLRSFVAIFKKSLRSLILYKFFHDFIHVYSPRAGADSP